MSFIGTLNIVIQAEDNCVTGARLQAPEEVAVENLFIDKTPQEVTDMTSMMFSLCPDSQTAAAELAMAAALTTTTDALIKKCLWLDHLELISEGIRFFLLQLAPSEHAKKHIKEIVDIRRKASELKQINVTSISAIEKGKKELAELALPLLLDSFSSEWEQDLLNGFSNPDAENLGAVFAMLSPYRSFGWCSLPLLKKDLPVLLEDVKEEKLWLSEGHKFNIRHLTGPVARQKKDPLISHLLTLDGNTAYTRLCARFVELIEALKHPTFPADASSSIRLDDGCGMSVIQNSRGLLFHLAWLKHEDGKTLIKDYKILTPTEINVTDSPAFLDSLKGIKAEHPEQLKKLVRLVVASYDPCTQINVEIEDA